MNALILYIHTYVTAYGALVIYTISNFTYHEWIP